MYSLFNINILEVFHLKLAARNLVMVVKSLHRQAKHRLAIANKLPSEEAGQDMWDKLDINSIPLDEFHLDNQVVEDMLNSY